MGHFAQVVPQEYLAHVNADTAAMPCDRRAIGKVLGNSGGDQFKICAVHLVGIFRRPQLVNRTAHGLLATHAVQQLCALVPGNNLVLVLD